MSGLGDRLPGGNSRRHFIAVLLTLGIAAFVILVFLAGIGVAAALSRATSAQNWSTWGNVGQTFESINTMFSGLAFAAIVVTFWFQLRELREERSELKLQREAATGSHDALRRAAEVDLRRLHVQLMQMSIEDPQLAAVWPEIEPGLSTERTKQYFYINLLIQHARLVFDLSWYDEEAVRAHLRGLFSSTLIREYWSTSRRSRLTLSWDPQELMFFVLVDETYREFLDSDHHDQEHENPVPEAGGRSDDGEIN